MAIKREPDILIVGAGAAGCALAYLLAREGRSVLLVERGRTVGKDKPCGGVLNDQGQLLMEQLYGAGTLDALGAAHIETMRVLYRDGETDLPMPFRALPRAKLDSFLLSQALQAGAQLAERTALEAVDEAAHTATCKDLATGEMRELAYGTLVAADGAYSATRRMITGAVPRTEVSYVAEVSAPEDGSVLVQRVYPAIAGGCWLIPQGETAVVGCLFFPGASHEPVGDDRKRMYDFAAELGCVPGKLRGAPVPAGDDILLRSPGGTYFIGDAAGLCEPALGAGIHLALDSALALSKELAGGMSYEAAFASKAARLRDAANSIAFMSLRLGYKVLVAGAK